VSWLAASMAASSLVVGFTPLLPWLFGLSGSVKQVLVAGHAAVAVMSIVALSANNLFALAAAFFLRALALGVVKACEQVMWGDVDRATARRTNAANDAKRKEKAARGNKSGGASTPAPSLGYGGAVGQREALSTVGGVVASLLSGHLAGRGAPLLLWGCFVVSALDALSVWQFWNPKRSVDTPATTAAKTPSIAAAAKAQVKQVQARKAAASKQSTQLRHRKPNSE